MSSGIYELLKNEAQIEVEASKRGMTLGEFLDHAHLQNQAIFDVSLAKEKGITLAEYFRSLKSKKRKLKPAHSAG